MHVFTDMKAGTTALREGEILNSKCTSRECVTKCFTSPKASWDSEVHLQANRQELSSAENCYDL